MLRYNSPSLLQVLIYVIQVSTTRDAVGWTEGTVGFSLQNCNKLLYDKKNLSHRVVSSRIIWRRRFHSIWGMKRRFFLALADILRLSFPYCVATKSSGQFPPINGCTLFPEKKVLSEWCWLRLPCSGFIWLKLPITLLCATHWCNAEISFFKRLAVASCELTYLAPLW